MKVLDRNGNELAVGDRVERHYLYVEGWEPDTVRGFDPARGEVVFGRVVQHRVKCEEVPGEPDTYRCDRLVLISPDSTTQQAAEAAGRSTA